MTNVVKSRLTLINRIPGGKMPMGLFQCECGNQKEIRISNVKAGVTKSCGCLQIERRNINCYKTHGLSGHPIYRVWNAMKDRCYRERSEDYPDYGGRGVVVCDEWKDDFAKFYDWAINNRWKKGLQIDKDIKAKEMKVEALIYSPQFCQFVTPKRNSNARRSNRVIEYKGEAKNFKQWCDLFKIGRTKFRNLLIKNNWVLDDELVTSLLAQKK